MVVRVAAAASLTHVRATDPLGWCECGVFPVFPEQGACLGKLHIVDGVSGWSF